MYGVVVVDLVCVKVVHGGDNGDVRHDHEDGEVNVQYK